MYSKFRRLWNALRGAGGYAAGTSTAPVYMAHNPEDLMDCPKCHQPTQDFLRHQCKTVAELRADSREPEPSSGGDGGGGGVDAPAAARELTWEALERAGWMTGLVRGFWRVYRPGLVHGIPGVTAVQADLNTFQPEENEQRAKELAVELANVLRAVPHA